MPRQPDSSAHLEAFRYEFEERSALPRIMGADGHGPVKAMVERFTVSPLRRRSRIPQPSGCSQGGRAECPHECADERTRVRAMSVLSEMAPLGISPDVVA